MTIIYILLVAHFIGDFVCQTDWMATNKSKRWDALGMHVAVYTLVLATFTVFWWEAAMFLAVNAGTHFVQDAITSRITSRFWFFQREDGVWVKADYTFPYTFPKRGLTLINPWMPTRDARRHWFFVTIGFDQLLHYVTLFVTAGWWLR